MNTHFLQNDLISRTMADTMAFHPPVIIKAERVQKILSSVEQGLERLAAEIQL